MSLRTGLLTLALTLMFGLTSAPSARAALIDWTDWVSSSTGPPDQVAGTMGGIAVTYTGLFTFVQTGAGTNYWTEGTPAPYTGNAVIDNAPPAAEMIALNFAASHNVTFSQAVLNPVMAIVSMGQPNFPVSYDFDTDFTLLSNGVGFWSGANGGLPGAINVDDPNDILTGNEVHAAIQFNGFVTQINWTSTTENWHGFTFGALASEAPEPGSLVLLGLGLMALGSTRARRRS